jgi:hypothetical protein
MVRTPILLGDDRFPIPVYRNSLWLPGLDRTKVVGLISNRLLTQLQLEPVSTDCNNSFHSLTIAPV